MSNIGPDETLEATEEQLTMLRELGVAESELEDVSFDDAEEWISELRAMREGAGKL